MREYQSSVYAWGSTADDALGCCPPDRRHRVGAAVLRVQHVPGRLAGCCSAILAGGGDGNGDDGDDGRSPSSSAMIIRVVASGGGVGTTAITDKFEAYSWGGGMGRGGGAMATAAKRGGGVRGKKSEFSSSSCTMERIRAPQDVTIVSHGTGHSCAVTSRGEIYGWGSNVHGTLGVNPDGKPSVADHGSRSRTQQNIAGVRNGGASRRGIAIPNPRKLDLGDLVGDDSSNVVTAVCGEKHTCILRRDGTILTAGANDAGQLGIGSAGHEDGPGEKGNNGFRIIRSSVRGGIKTLVAFRELTCGNNHCAAISSCDASLYTWGWGQSGRLGTGDERGRDRPTHVEALTALAPLATVSCGSAHTLVSTVDGDVYGFGWNAHGQVVSGRAAAKDDDEKDGASSSDVCLLPVPCLMQKGVVALSCGGFHTAAITQNGSLYLWGMNEDGQCGAGHEMPITCPLKVAFQDAGSERYAVSVSCGRSFTVCVMSNFLPLEVKALIDRLKETSSASETSLMDGIVSDKREPDVNDQVIQSSEPDPLPVVATDSPPVVVAVDDLELDDDSSSESSHSSLSDDHDVSNLEGPLPQKEIIQELIMSDESAQRLIEMQKMNDEDHRSAAYVAHSRRLRQLAMDAERLAIEKSRIEVEQKCMHAEDILSRKLGDQIKLDNKLKRPTNKSSIERDDLIDKAANRMRLVRERRERETKAKKILPVVHRRPLVKKEHTEVLLPDIVNDKQLSNAEVARLERRRELIRRRELRLKTREEEEREAALKLEQQKLEEQQRQLQQQRQERLNLEELMKKEENAKKMMLLRKTAELKRLEDDLKRNSRLRLPRLDENKENNSIFCDLNHWTKKLSGV